MKIQEQTTKKRERVTTVRLPPRVRMQLKVASAKLGQTMETSLEQAVLLWLTRGPGGQVPIPNITRGSIGALKARLASL